MNCQSETPFENIDSALEYVTYLLEAIQEAEEQIEAEIEHTSDVRALRRKDALLLARQKLGSLSLHISKSHRLLNDLTMLRRLLLDKAGTSEVWQEVELPSN